MVSPVKSSSRSEPRAARHDARVQMSVAAEPRAPWWQWAVVPALLGSLLLWASFPPLDLWPLAWLAPAPWIWLVRQPRLLGWKPYLQIWFAGWVHWLLMLQGIRLAHPALYGGWLALSAYLAIYLVLFVSISRVAVHRLRWPLYLVAPMVFVSLELFRGHLISGFSSGLLSHTQTSLPVMLQIADLGGAYALSLVMMLVASVVVQFFPSKWFGDRAPASFVSDRLAPAALAALAILFTVGYGIYRLQEHPPTSNRAPLQVALIQGSLDTKFDQDFQERINTTFGHYGKLTRDTVAQHPNLDLVIWPESMFTIPEFRAAELPLIANAQDEKVKIARERMNEMQRSFTGALGETTKLVNPVPSNSDGSEQVVLPATGTWFLFGSTTLMFDLLRPEMGPVKNYNAAILASPDAEVAQRYYKMHAVMFGEYIPVADLLPFLYRLTPMGAGMSTGEAPVPLPVKQYTLAPNICFESTVPHLIRQQVLDLERTGQRPVDAIVNVTNDGWFWGSSILDLHFRCSVFRAIENRKPVIIAANTGISAHIDGSGRVLEQGPKRAPGPLVASVISDGRRSPYHTWGDAPIWLLAWITWGVAVYGVWKR
jgi:apolipoprotein N-acyltransferase